MRDRDIRAALSAELLIAHGHDPDTLVKHELGLCAGSRRVDIAVINGELAGIEIKSDEDTLMRLAGQREVYERVLDRITIVTTERHVLTAIKKVPRWWGVQIARDRVGYTDIETYRTSGLNAQIQPYAVAQLLWRDEALAELSARDAARGLHKKSRHYVWEALANAIELDELQRVVRERLRARRSWSPAR